MTESLVFKKLITGLQAKGKARPRARVVCSKQVNIRIRGLTGNQRPWAQIYMPGEYNKYVKRVRKLLGTLEPFKCYAVRIYCTRKMPKSWSKAKQQQHLGRLVTAKPDRDNLVGAIMDAIAPEEYIEDEDTGRKKKVPGTGDEMIAVLRDIEVRWWYEHTIYVDAYEVDRDERVIYPWLKRPGDEKGLFE